MNKSKLLKTILFFFAIDFLLTNNELLEGDMEAGIAVDSWEEVIIPLK